MSGCFGNHPEDRSRSNELDRYLAQQESGEVYEAAVQEEVTELTASGAEYDPFGPRNLGETFAELSSTQLVELSGLFTKARTSQCNCDLLQAAKLLHALSVAYWIDLAKNKAEQNVSKGS